MKSIYVIFILCCAFILQSCAKELTKEQSENVYSHSVQLSKAELKLKILSFINENYMSGKSVLQINEDGLISGNVVSQFAVITAMEYSFIIKYQDSTYKVKCIVKRMFRGSEDVSASDWGYYADKVMKEFNSFDEKLFVYLSKKSNANDF
jgi:hypothetical protein